MPKLGRRIGPLGVALTAFDLWKRIPPKQRKKLLSQAKTHGPKLAKKAVAARRKPRS